MGRKEDLEKRIRDSYKLIQEYETIIQTSSDPKDKLRSREMIKEQWDLIWEYLEEYIPLCIRQKKLVPDDITQLPVPDDITQLVVAHYGEQDLAPLYVKGLLWSLNSTEFRNLSLDLLEAERYRIEDDREGAIVLASRESRLKVRTTWVIQFMYSPDPGAWIHRRGINYRELERLSEQLSVDGYFFITSAQFSDGLHKDFQTGLEGREVHYWDRPIITDRLLHCPSLWQEYASPYQLTKRSPLLTACYQLLDDDLLAREFPVNAKAFYEGNKPGWGEIKADLDARRTVYFENRQKGYEQLFKAIASTVRKKSGPSFILISAEAGAGKTTVLFRIGYDLHQLNEPDKEDTHRVLRLWYDASPHAYPLIELYEQTQKPLYMLMDIHDTKVQMRGLDGILSELRDQEIPVTVIAAARSNEWELAQGWQSIGKVGIPSAKIELGKLSSQEIKAILDLLQKHNLFLHPLDSRARKQMEDLFIKKADRQLFVALMEITHGKNFETILLDEYKNLPGMAQIAYRYVCLLHAYGILLPRDLLISILKLSQSIDPLSEVLIPTQGVIIEDEERTGYVRARHQLIAEVLKNRLEVFRDIQCLEQMVSSIIEATRYYKGIERYIVLKLLLGLVNDSMYSLEPETRKEFVKGLMDTHSEKIANMLYRAKVEGRYIELAEWGRLYYELDELKMDKKCLEDALDIAPLDESIRLNYYYGRVLRELGHPEARRYFELAYHPEMEVVEFLHNFAQLEIEVDHFEQAAKLLERALVVEPGNKTCRETYTILLDRLKTEKQYDRIVSVCKAGLQANPNNAQTRWSLAITLQALGQNEEAVEQFKAIIQLEPDHEAALQYCASTLMVLGPAYYKEAANLYERAIEIHSTKDVLWAQLRNNYALLLVQMGEDYYSQAEALWEEVVRKWPKFAWAHLEFGDFLFRKKQEYKKSLGLICNAVAVAERTDTSQLLPRVCSRAKELLDKIEKEIGQARCKAILEGIDSADQLLANLVNH